MPYHRTKNLTTVSANGCLSRDQYPKSGSQLQFVSGAPGARVVEGEKELKERNFGEETDRMFTRRLHERSTVESDNFKSVKS